MTTHFIDAAKHALGCWQKVKHSHSRENILDLARSEQILANEFAKQKLKFSNIELDGWTVIIEACEVLMEGRSVPVYPMITYRAKQ